MADDFPYRAEYAKSNRSSCRACKTQIGKDSLRLAAMVQSHMFDGKTPQWYHFMCFFGKQRVKAVGDIEHFESLKWEDQEKIKKKVDATGSSDTNGDAGEKKGKKRPSKAKSKDKDASLFAVENAKSGRAGCRGCEEKILKGEVRISKMDYESEEGRRYGGIPRWHHVDCFTKLRIELEFFSSGETLNGYNSLSKEEKEKVKTALPKIAEVKKEAEDGESAPKKIKTEPADEKHMETMKKQNKTLHKYIDQLKQLGRKDLHAILIKNKQEVSGGDSVIIERIADCMTFGALKPCEKCEGQFLYVSGIGYKCSGDLTEWVKCDNVLLEPPRVPFKAPKDLVEEHSFLKIKSKVTNRALQLNQRSVTIPQPSTSGPKIKSERLLPLKNMEFVVLGKTEMSKEEIKTQIVKMGGKLTTKIHDKLAAVISNQDEVDKMGSRMSAVQEYDIQVVPESFLQESVAGGALENISKLNIASWGADPKKRMAKVEEQVLKSSKSKSMFTKSVPSKVTLKIKGGSAVDPDSGLEDIAHVYNDGKALYSTVLGLTDLALKVNKYYKMQVLESDNKSRYWFFRSWGRIGTTIGDTKLEKMGSLGEALKQFKFHYGEKSGNDWANRNNFKKVAGKMVPMDLNYGEDETDNIVKNITSDVESKLPKPVQDLVSLILNVESMKKVMLEFELDLQKMPLGKISKRQIQQAYGILSELLEILKQSEPSRAVLMEASNRFYTLIPHDFGMDNPPLLDSEDIIKTKLEMLESLLDLEIAYNIMKPSNDETADVHPIDSHYSKLNTDIAVLEKDSKEFDLLQQYVKNTHAETHNQYGLEILEAFKISRHGEEKRYKPFKKLPNKKLLWHGSRLTNYAGILSQGLRIAPPEAPSTGYMFGKGIYFADMVSKSANYCMTSPTNNTGIMLLCEVALGNMYERTSAEYVEKLPKGMHSTKGIGATAPDPEHSVKLEGDVEVPLGKGKSLVNRHETSLLYNEYIVYDVAQVKAQYLLKMKFNYKF